MCRFQKFFILRTAIGLVLLGALVNTCVQMSFRFITVDDKKSALAAIYILPLLMGAVYSFSITAITVHNTRTLRKNDLSLPASDEYKLFRNTALIMILLAVVNAAFLYYKAAPFIDSALNEAVHRIMIMNYNTDTEKRLTNILNDCHSSYIKGAKTALAAECVLQAAVFLLSAGRSVRVYQNPKKDKKH